MFRESQKIGVYTLIRKLGQGGFGEVWLAENRSHSPSEKVAIKLPRTNQIDLQAVKDEIFNWILSGRHKNILPIIECETFGNQIAIVSEYAPDGSLQNLINKKDSLPISDAIEITIGILDGLAHLHNRKIIHRDLKPDNVLFQGNVPRLTDFGISRAMTVSSQSQTVSGTLSYMAPEAFDGRRSVQTDIWSVGVNLYQFLTGSLPFPQKEFTQLLTAIAAREPKPLPDFVPPELKRIITKSLEKLPENRYKTASEMREDLYRVKNGKFDLKSSYTEQLSQIQQSVQSQQATSTIKTIVKLPENVSLQSSSVVGSIEKGKFVDETKLFKNKFIVSIFLFLAIFIFISLISSNPNDWSLTTDSSQKTRNWIGTLGSITADLLFQLIGLTAYLIPALLALIAWWFYQAKSSLTIPRRFFGYFLFIILTSSLVSLIGWRGGITGAFLVQNMTWLFGKIGASIVFSVIYIVSLLLITGFSFSSAFKRAG